MSMTYKPPAEVQAAAKRGLELRAKYKRGGWTSKRASQEGIGSGVVRASTLAAGRGVSADTLRRMVSFFARHDGEVERNARQRDETSAANIAWLLWGGDPGRAWAKKMVAEINNGKVKNEMTLMILESDKNEVMSLKEGLLPFLKNLATGDIEDDIDEIEKEIKDIHTPEQQRILIDKIIALLDNLVKLRHDPSFIQSSVHDSLTWFQKQVDSNSPDKELKLRTGEAIARLARIRDRVLSKKWEEDTYNQKADELRKKVSEVLNQSRGDE